MCDETSVQCTLKLFLILLLVTFGVLLIVNSEYTRTDTIPSVQSQKSKPKPIRILERKTDPSFSYPLNNKTKLIVLATLFRSGSTFLGELFNQNPDVLYDFESFHDETMRARVNEDRGSSGTIMGCGARHSADEANMLFLQQTLYNCSILPSCFLDVMHRYWRCGATPEENNLLFGERECKDKGYANIVKARQYHCKHRAAVAIKVIRLRRIRDIELITDIQNTDLKIIHLVRDPRAMFRSRSGFKDIFQAKRHQLQWTVEERYTKLALEAHTVCENYLSDMEFVKGHPWLKHRYKIVKHDDMGREPIKTAEEVYEFVGLPLPQIIKDFLINTTTSGHVEGELSTQKDSAAVLDKWYKWRIKEIGNIDKHCAMFIRQMGWGFHVDQDVTSDELQPFL